MKERFDERFKKFLGLDKPFKVKDHQLGSIIGEKEIEAVTHSLTSGKGLSWTGDNLWKFEEEFSAYCGVKHAVAVSSCTAALRIATQILRISKGDEIISTPNSFTATILAAAERGSTIRFADIDPHTLNIDPATIQEKISPKTKAIFLTHVNGNPVDMDPVLDIAKQHGLVVVEDAAHAPGAEYKARKIGSIGDITCFSFHSLKNMTTGEGGMLTTNNDRYAEEARTLRSIGIVGELQEKNFKAIGPYHEPQEPLFDQSGGAYRYEFIKIEEWGTHSRMSDITAAVGRAQLEKLDSMNEKRIGIATRYNESFGDVRGLRLYQTTPESKCVYHLYPILLDRSIIKENPNTVGQYLENEKGIHIIRRFFPLHLNTYMQFLGHRYGECPVCEKIYFEEQLNLPIWTGMSDKQVEIVIRAMRDTAEHYCK